MNNTTLKLTPLSMPAYGAAKTKAPELSIAHAHAATATGTRHVKPPRHDATSRDAASQYRREACAGRTTAHGTAPKAARNEPIPAPGAALSTPPGASSNAKRDSVRATVSSYGCGQMRLRRLESFKDT